MKYQNDLSEDPNAVQIPLYPDPIQLALSAASSSDAYAEISDNLLDLFRPASGLATATYEPL